MYISTERPPDYVFSPGDDRKVYGPAGRCKKKDIVPSHQEPWWCGLVLEKADGHHKQLGITHLYSSYSWANGLTSFQLLQPSTKIQCDLLPSPSKVIFWSEWQGRSVFPEENPNLCCFVLHLYIYLCRLTCTLLISWPAVKTELKVTGGSQGWQPFRDRPSQAVLNQSTEHPEPDLSSVITLIFLEKGRAS